MGRRKRTIKWSDTLINHLNELYKLRERTRAKRMYTKLKETIKIEEASDIELTFKKEHEGSGTISTWYKSLRPYWVVATGLEEGKITYISAETCREYFIRGLCTSIANNIPYTIVMAQVNSDLTLEKKLNAVMKGLYIVRMYETALKWDYSVIKSLDVKGDAPCYIVEPNENWLKGPHALSLFCMLIRSAHQYYNVFDDICCPDCFEQAVHGKAKVADDSQYFSKHVQHFFPFLCNLDNIYGDKGSAHHFNPKTLTPGKGEESATMSSSHMAKEGIQLLLSGNTRHKEVLKATKKYVTGK